MLKNTYAMRIITNLLVLFFVSSSLNLTYSQGILLSEDFDGGLPSEWTLRKVLGNDDSTSNWQYTTSGPDGDYPIDPISSTSAENGWMIFDSDKNCNIGVGQDAWLISPEIDITGVTELYLSFETFYRNFYDRPQIRLGSALENFDSWETIEIFPDIENNQFSGILEGDEGLNPHKVIADLTEFINSNSTLYFAFQFLSDNSVAPNSNDFGCAYAWQIDDVVLTTVNPGNQHDLRLSQHNVAPNYATPVSQSDTIFPAVVITNAGIATQSGIVATITIEDENQDVIFSYEEAISDLAAQESVLLIADDKYLPEVEGSFNIVYAVTQDSTDNIPNNNIIEQGYIITENLFSKDDNAIITALSGLGESAEFWEGGCYYYVPNDGYLATEAIISVASNNGGQDHLGEAVSLLLYEINEDEDTSAFTTADTEILGFGTFTYTDEENFLPVTIPLFSLDGGEEPGVELTGGKEYLLMVQYTPNMYASASELSYPYGISTVVKDGETWYLGGFSNGNTLLVRMRIASMNSTAVKTLNLLNDEFNVFPNPAVTSFTTNFSLSFDPEYAVLELINVDGKVVANQPFLNTRSGQTQFDVNQLPAGNYFVRLTTNEGIATRKIIIQH
jgi:hypothetical protein